MCKQKICQDNIEAPMDDSSEEQPKELLFFWNESTKLVHSILRGDGVYLDHDVVIVHDSESGLPPFFGAFLGHTKAEAKANALKMLNDRKALIDECISNLKYL